jgi:hypothetical protein
MSLCHFRNDEGGTGPIVRQRCSGCHQSQQYLLVVSTILYFMLQTALFFPVVVRDTAAERQPSRATWSEALYAPCAGETLIIIARRHRPE